MFEDHTILGGWSKRIEADIFNSEMISSNGKAGGILLVYEGQVLGLGRHGDGGEYFANNVYRLN